VDKVLEDIINSRRLGSSDLIVSEICLGTMTYGEQNSEKEAHEQLACAWDQAGLPGYRRSRLVYWDQQRDGPVGNCYHPP